jgi:hypothetical protein
MSKFDVPLETPTAKQYGIAPATFDSLHTDAYNFNETLYKSDYWYKENNGSPYAARKAGEVLLDEASHLGISERRALIDLTLQENSKMQIDFYKSRYMPGLSITTTDSGDVAKMSISYPLNFGTDLIEIK